MPAVTLRYTNDPTIIKFEFDEFIVPPGNHHFENIDQAKDAPLAKELFYFPFVKSVYFSGNFVAVERYNIVEWPAVAEEVAEQITNFLNNGGQLIKEAPKSAAKAVTVYAEMTPNPAALKFVVNFMLTKRAVTFKNIDQTASSPLARALFELPYVKEIYLDENYLSITKFDLYHWDNITQELRTFIKGFFDHGGIAIDASESEQIQQDKDVEAKFESLEPIAQQIVQILEEYVKPAVAADGGNIAFDSFDADQKKVKVILQGACNGCPSATFTLKSGIENMLKQLLQDEQITVEALNG